MVRRFFRPLTIALPIVARDSVTDGTNLSSRTTFRPRPYKKNLLAQRHANLFLLDLLPAGNERHYRLSAPWCTCPFRSHKDRECPDVCAIAQVRMLRHFFCEFYTWRWKLAIRQNGWRAHLKAFDWLTLIRQREPQSYFVLSLL